jgi:glycosyltransferase involved in cell wall biosynthesis
MSAAPIISICIPTYRRPQDLCRAVESCLKQTDQALEIIIGDDTPDDSVGLVIVRRFPEEARIRYIHNVPSLQQAANVDNLFRQAKGEWIILLHDDDYLEPAALAIYLEQINKYTRGDLFFGKQHLQTSDGLRILDNSETFNKAHGRTSDDEGEISNPTESVLRKQIPSNGFCVRASLAQEVGYPGLPDAGDACDWVFGVRLALNNANFIYVNTYVSTYVLSNNSVGRNNPRGNSALCGLKTADHYLTDQKGTKAYADFLAGAIGPGISQAINHGEINYAWNLIRLAWADKHVPRGIVIREFLKFVLLYRVLFKCKSTK